jgi:hypothetical protein
MFVMAAILAGVDRALGDAVMLRNLLALWTKDTVRIELVLQPFQARCVIGELAVKFHLRKRALGCDRSDRVITIRLAHIQIYTKRTYLRQGDTYPS